MDQLDFSRLSISTKLLKRPLPESINTPLVEAIMQNDWRGVIKLLNQNCSLDGLTIDILHKKPKVYVELILNHVYNRYGHNLYLVQDGNGSMGEATMCVWFRDLRLDKFVHLMMGSKSVIMVILVHKYGDFGKSMVEDVWSYNGRMMLVKGPSLLDLKKALCCLLL